MEWLRRSAWLVCIAVMLTSLSLEAQALEGIKLVKAGFTATPAKEDFRKQEPASSAEMQLKTLENGKVFFWTEIQCTQECGQLGAEKMLVAHRWVRDYGVNVVTTQIKEFSLKELIEKENVLQSAQEITPGAWFVEVRIESGGGPKLCLSPTEKDAPEICKFVLRIK